MHSLIYGYLNIFTTVIVYLLEMFIVKITEELLQGIWGDMTAEFFCSVPFFLQNVAKANLV